MFIHIISIDIGLRNLAVVSKRYTAEELAAIPCVSADLRFDAETGEMLPSYKKCLESIYKAGAITYFYKKCFIEKGQVGKVTEIDDETLRDITDYLFTIPEVIPTMENNTIVLIESQITKNHIAIRIQNHIHSTIVNMNAPEVHLVPNWLKTRRLGAPKKQSEYERKKWAYATASLIIHQYQPDIHPSMYRCYNKDRADLSDAYLQMQAWLTGARPSLSARI